MRLAQSSRGGWFSPLFLMITVIMAAALGLGYYSYHSAVQLAESSERSVESSNRALGLKLIDRIEKVIIDGDRTFFRLVRLDDPKEFKELWRRIVRVSPAVESVVVLDERYEVVHLVTRLDPHRSRSFRRRFVNRILPDMELDKLPPNQHRHLHKEYDGRFYLLSYIRRQSDEGDYYIALSVNIPYVIRDTFRAEFKELEETNRIAVMDEVGRVLYGQRIALPSRLVFEERFPTTLYKWRLQLAPGQVTSLARGARVRRLTDLVLVGSGVGVIWLGMLVLFVAARKERRANQLKSDFISNVSHELKTPLSLIRMFGELIALQRFADAETGKEYAEIITRESDRLTALIDNVLDFARIERGKADYDMELGDLSRVAERVCELSHYRAEQAGVTLRTEVESGLPEVAFDESAMTLLLLNLIENSLKYGASQGEQVVIGLRREGDELRLSVSDSGPGIPPEERKRIFERFYRGASIRGRSQRGTGIGLSLVKHIAEGHGGTVRAGGELGKGAVFEVSIPIERA